MPTRERVQAFVARMERGEHYALMRDFYAEDATAQENNEPPRVGLAAMMENERRANERLKFPSTRAKSVLVDGDRVAINWVFEITAGEHAFTLDEVAYQEWRGDRIIRERYFYDPAQMRPKTK
jgi:hypothetical protein